MPADSTDVRATPAYIEGQFGEFAWSYTLVFPGANDNVPSILDSVFRIFHSEFRQTANAIFDESYLKTDSALRITLCGDGDEPNQFWPIYLKLRGLFQPTHPYYALSETRVQPDKSAQLTFRVVGSDSHEGVENQLLGGAYSLDCVHEVTSSPAIGAIFMQEGQPEETISFDAPPEVLMLGPSLTIHFTGGETSYQQIQDVFARHDVFLPDLTHENRFDLQG